MEKTFKTIDELIKEENSFISAIPNNLGINLCSVKGIEYELRKDRQLQSLKILFNPFQYPDKSPSVLQQIVTPEAKLMDD